MVRQNTSDRGSEKFVQWKETPQCTGGAPHDGGDASASRGRKTKWCTPGTLHVRDAGSAGTMRSEAGAAIPTSLFAEENATNPSSRFVPPRRINARTSSVPISGANAEHSAPKRVYRTPPQAEAEEGHEDSANVEAGTSTAQKRSVPTGRACNWGHLLSL
jgi:hypothetical protein